MMTGDKLNGGHGQPGHGVLRFKVSRGPEHVEAFISRTTCQAGDGGLDGGLQSDGSLAEFVRQHRSQLDRIVLGKLNAGARHPVVVMARDLWLPTAPAVNDWSRIGPVPAAPLDEQAAEQAIEQAIEQAQPA